MSEYSGDKLHSCRGSSCPPWQADAAIHHFAGYPWAAGKWLLSSLRTGDEDSYFLPKICLLCDDLIAREEVGGRRRGTSRREEECCWAFFKKSSPGSNNIYIRSLNIFSTLRFLPNEQSLPQREFRHFVFSQRKLKWKNVCSVNLYHNEAIWYWPICSMKETQADWIFEVLGVLKKKKK